MIAAFHTLALTSLFLNSFIVLIESHGRLLEPAARSSLWRFSEYLHLNPPIDYNDNELNCGGFQVQHGQNGGKCGECGDAFHLERPRDHETGGKYGSGIIARKYLAGELIEVHVQLTANHLGYFEFRLCPLEDTLSPVTQECLDKYILPQSNGLTKHFVQKNVNEYRYSIQLPENVTCSQCVLQWHYQAGNNWGICQNGSGAVGCGPQETFRGCSDIAIV